MFLTLRIDLWPLSIHLFFPIPSSPFARLLLIPRPCPIINPYRPSGPLPRPSDLLRPHFHPPPGRSRVLVLVFFLFISNPLSQLSEARRHLSSLGSFRRLRSMS